MKSNVNHAAQGQAFSKPATTASPDLVVGAPSHCWSQVGSGADMQGFRVQFCKIGDGIAGAASQESGSVFSSLLVIVQRFFCPFASLRSRLRPGVHSFNLLSIQSTTPGRFRRASTPAPRII